MPTFLDAEALEFLECARVEYLAMGLDSRLILDQGRDVQLLTWLGDAGNEALACLFQQEGFFAAAGDLGIEVRVGRGGVDGIVGALAKIASMGDIDGSALVDKVDDLQRAKWDWALPQGLLRKSYASQYLDVEEAIAWAKACGMVGSRAGTTPEHAVDQAGSSP